MILLVGLGNPGPKYECTRHNAGFLVLDEIADHFGVGMDSQKFQAVLGKGKLFSHDCVYLKPLEFMNRSGRAVRLAMQFYKIPADQVITLHDDIDMEFGKVKAKLGGGHGGHNGIRSMISELGGEDLFARVKIGIGRPKSRQDGDVSNWVLSSFSDEELISIQTDVKNASLLRIEGMLQQRS